MSEGSREHPILFSGPTGPAMKPQDDFRTIKREDVQPSLHFKDYELLAIGLNPSPLARKVLANQNDGRGRKLKLRKCKNLTGSV